MKGDENLLCYERLILELKVLSNYKRFATLYEMLGHHCLSL